MDANSNTLDLEDGFYAEIHYDPDAEMPYRDDDGVKIVVLHPHYIDPSQGAVGRSLDEIEAWSQNNDEEWYSIRLWLYDHSGTVYRVAGENPFQCRWDSSRVGIIALQRSEWGNGKESDDKMFQYARDVAKEYSEWANGSCYGFVLYNQEDEKVDSCWGFVGTEAVEQAANEAFAVHIANKSAALAV